MKRTSLVLIAFSSLLVAKAQNSCSTALSVGIGSHVVSGIDGPEAANPLCAGIELAQIPMAEWYTYTSPVDTLVNISTVLSGVDTRFHVYRGTCGALICYAGDDDSGPYFTSTASFDVTADVTYTIAFDNGWSSSGFTFVISEVAPIVPPEGTVLFTAVPLGGGANNPYGLVDMNGDHLDDVVSPGTTNINVLRQGPGGSLTPFNYTTTPADHTASWSMAAGDLDGNGFNDLQYGAQQGVTFMMANDDGTGFTEVSFAQYVFSQRGNMVDINNDGNLDAFMCHDVDANVSFMNDGAGNLMFAQGLFGTTCGNYGSIWVDYDNDGDMDCFVAKCGCDPVDLLIRNDGNGVYTNVAPALGLADGHQSWSSAWGDFDNDGDQDVLIGSSSSNSHKLMRNNGDATFTNVTAGSGFDLFGGQSIEWNSRDFNNDGYLDVIGGGALHYNNGDFTFSSDLSAPGNGPIGDINNDGFLDILIGSTAYRNSGNDNNHLTVTLNGVISNTNGIGARVLVTSALGTQTREIRSGDGFRYMSSLNAHFGLGADTEVLEVEVRWPSGHVDVFTDVVINEPLNAVEGISTGVTAGGVGDILGVYPNPATDVITLKGNKPFLNNRFRVSDVTGKHVLEGSLLNNQLDVAGLTSGVYVLSVTVDGGSIQQRFSKQ